MILTVIALASEQVTSSVQHYQHTLMGYSRFVGISPAKQMSRLASMYQNRLVGLAKAKIRPLLTSVVDKSCKSVHAGREGKVIQVCVQVPYYGV